MDKTKIYVQPLGFLRGLTDSGDKFARIAGGNIFFSALKIISRANGKISQEIIYIDQLEEYLINQPEDKGRQIRKILQQIKQERPPLSLKNNIEISWQKTIIQGVLNVTPDSFSDGGIFENINQAVAHAHKMIVEGASLIDIGGESTRPGAERISTEQEISRVLPIIVALKESNIPISIDSRSGDVMKAAHLAGAHIINDVSALTHDISSMQVVRDSGLPVVLMHAQGNPENMQDKPEYDNVLLDIYDYLESRIEACLANGIEKEKIIVDPGIGFGKTVSHNLQILNNLALFHGLGVPLLIGVSRKSFIGKITNEAVAANRVSGSIAAALICLDQGAQIIRAHDVKETFQAISVWQAACGISDIN